MVVWKEINENEQIEPALSVRDSILGIIFLEDGTNSLPSL